MKRFLILILAAVLLFSTVPVTGADAVNSAAKASLKEQFYAAYDFVSDNELVQIDAIYSLVDHMYTACDAIRTGMVSGNYRSTEYLYVCLRIIRSSLEKIVYDIEYMTAACVNETVVRDGNFYADMKIRQREIDDCIARIGEITAGNLLAFSSTPLYRSYARQKRDSVEQIIAGLGDIAVSAAAIPNLFWYIDNLFSKATDVVLEEKIGQILRQYPSETSYFSVGKKMCLHNNMEENVCCMLRNVLIDSGLTWWNDDDFEDGFACQGFARYAFKYLYGLNWNIEKNHNLIKINSGNGRVGADFYKNAKKGDLLSLSGHYAIFISADEDGITLYHANYGGSSENLGYVAHHHRPYAALSASWEATEIYRCTTYTQSLLTYEPLKNDFTAVSAIVFSAGE